MTDALLQSLLADIEQEIMNSHDEPTEEPITVDYQAVKQLIQDSPHRWATLKISGSFELEVDLDIRTARYYDEGQAIEFESPNFTFWVKKSIYLPDSKAIIINPDDEANEINLEL